MTPLYVLNDLHAGAVRTAGTTPTTQWQLRQATLDSFASLLSRCDGDVLINGDWLDATNISQYDLLQVYSITFRWLSRGFKLFASRGNHDASRNSTQLSSFDFLVKLLASLYPKQVVPILEPTLLSPEIWVCPHLPTQDLFDLEMSRIPSGVSYAFLHANWNNHFAAQSDLSLNVSEDLARTLPVDHLIFGHIHQQSEALNGKVVVVGSQICTSISDCLGNATKRMLKITDNGMEFIETWKAEGDYCEMSWRSLADTGARFIRIIGEATAGEAAAVAQAVSRFRSTSKALVLSNAVRIEGMNDQEALALSHAEVTSFNVRAALKELLTEEENKKLEALDGAE